MKNMSLREQEERDLAEAIRQSLALVQPEGYSFLPTFAERLPKAKICVIGANYAELDNERWSQIDPYYIGIEGARYVPDLIPDNPIEKFNWNSNPGSISMLFKKGPLKGKKFESIIIDRGTFHHIRNIMVLYSFFRVQQKFGPYAEKFYLEEDVINKIPELKEKIHKLEQNIANAGDDRVGIEFMEKKKDGLEDILENTKNRMDTVWQFLEPDIVDIIEVVGHVSNRFYGYHFK